MAGRYGSDEFGRALNFAALAVLIAGIFTTPVVTAFGFAGAAYNYYRMLSKNRPARLRENAAYLKRRNAAIKKFSGMKLRVSQRKTHSFFKCASCGKTVRVPKGKGLIEITCPVCKSRFDKKT